MRLLQKLERLKGDRRGVGLLAVWASAIAAMITVYIIFQLVTPLMGQIDYAIQDYILTSPVGFDATWMELYTTLSAFMQQAFAMVIYAIFISLLVFIVVQSARRRTDEYEDEL